MGPVHKNRSPCFGTIRPRIIGTDKSRRSSTVIDGKINGNGAIKCCPGWDGMGILRGFALSGRRHGSHLLCGWFRFLSFCGKLPPRYMLLEGTRVMLHQKRKKGIFGNFSHLPNRSVNYGDPVIPRKGEVLTWYAPPYEDPPVKPGGPFITGYTT